MKKIILFAICYLLFAGVAFAQFSPVGLIPFLLGQTQRKASLPPSIAEQVPVLFTGPSWCPPCRSEWDSGKIPSNVKAIVIVPGGGRGPITPGVTKVWIFPVDIFGKKEFLSGEVTQAIATKYGGKIYTGQIPKSVPAVNAISSSALPGNQAVAPKLPQITYRGPNLEEIKRRGTNPEDSFLYLLSQLDNDKKIKLTIYYENQRKGALITVNGKPIGGTEKEVKDFYDYLLKLSPPKPPKIEKPPVTFTGDETVEIVRLIDVDYVDGKPMIDVEVKICVGDQCRMETWKISIEEFRELKKSKIPIDPKKPLSQPISQQEKEEINKTYLKKRQELINRGMKSEVERIEKELGIPSSK